MFSDRILNTLLYIGLRFSNKAFLNETFDPRVISVKVKGQDCAVALEQ